MSSEAGELERTERLCLQLLIDATAKAGADYYRAQQILNEWSRERYGCEPGDVDADSIIDAVFGGCGEPVGMKAAEYHRIMTELSQ